MVGSHLGEGEGAQQETVTGDVAGNREEPLPDLHGVTMALGLTYSREGYFVRR